MLGEPFPVLTLKMLLAMTFDECKLIFFPPISFLNPSTSEKGFRDNKVIFTGDMGTFFACKDSSNEDYIWKMTDITDDEIEYRTKLYTTNVRPKDPLEPTGGRCL